MKAQNGLQMGLADFATLVGRDRTTVGAWLRQGLPAVRRSGTGGAHQIDVGRAIHWLVERAEAAADKVNPAAEAARTRKLQAEARIAEANAREREGELVPADEVGERWGRMALAMREGVLALPAIAVQRGLVAPEHEAALAELAHDALRELAARGAA